MTSDSKSLQLAGPFEAAEKPTGNIDSDVLNLIRLQSFDGSFAPTPGLEQIVGLRALAHATICEVERTVWATVLAIAYLRKYLTAQPELLESLVEKALDFVAQAPDVKVQELLNAATVLLV